MDSVKSGGSDQGGSKPRSEQRLRPEELADRVVPSNPQISPDGSRVVFVADPVGRTAEKKTSTLWLAEGDGIPCKITLGTAADRDPSWSPDASRLLFRSNRLASEDGEERLLLLPMAGGEAAPLSSLGGELSRPSWSPCGRLVAVLRRDPESPAVRARKKERDDPIVVEEEPRFKRLWLIDVKTGKFRCLTTGDREVRDYGWLPDGSAAVTITTDATETDAFYGAAELWRVPVDGALPKRIARFVTTPSLPVVVNTATEPIVAVRADGGWEDPADSVWVVPISGGEPRRVLPAESGSVEELTALPGWPGHVAARIVERTHGTLYAVDIHTGEKTVISAPELVKNGSLLEGVTFSNSGEWFAGIWSNAATPEEVWVGKTGHSARPVTSFGATFQGRLRSAEHVTWRSDGNVEIEGLLILPSGYVAGQRYPLVVHVHGGPSWQWEDRAMLDWHDWAQLLASHGYAVLLPNPRGSTAYGADFQRLLQNDVGGGESCDIVSGAMAMVARGIADPDRLGIGGWSWGGYLTARTITLSTIFRAAAMGAGLANLVSDHGQGDIPSMNLLLYTDHPYRDLDAYWEASPIRHVAAVQTPTLILHGDEDARVHPVQGMEFFRALKILGVPVQFVRYPREDHGIHERAHQIDLMNRMLAWYDRYLNGHAEGARRTEEFSTG